MSMEVSSSATYLASNKVSWWSTHTTKEKKLIIGCGVAACFALVFLCCTIGLGTKKRYEANCAAQNGTTTCECPGGICNTRLCIQTANEMKNKMNEDVNPCEDFYSFACQRFESTLKGPGNIFEQVNMEFNSDLRDILSTQDPETIGSPALKSAVRLYNKCLNQGLDSEDIGTTAVREVVEGVLGTTWPFAVGDEWNETNFNPSQSLARFIKVDGSGFVRQVIMPDIQNPGRLSLAIAYSVPSFSALVNVKHLVCTVYPNCSTNTTLDPQMGIESNSVLGEQVLMSEEENIVLPESTADKLRNVTKYTLEDLKVKAPEVDWTAFFETLFTGTDVKMSETFSVYVEEATLNSINSLLLNDKRNVANVIGLAAVQKWGEILSPRIRAAWPIAGEPPEICLSLVKNVYEFSLGKLYINEFLSDDILKEIMDVANRIKDGFKNILEGSDWLDKETLGLARRKVENMNTFIGSPSWKWSDETLSTFYKEAEVTKESTFEEGAIKAATNKINQKLNELSKPYERGQSWRVSTLVTNAFYDSQSNSMYYPLGILRSPFYVHGRSWTINLGSLGYVAGHELTHGFDFNGKDFDENGSIKDWWSSDTRKKFETGARCFVKQYNAVKDEQSQLNLNGKLTLSENIADNGGLRVAFQAFQNAPLDRSGKLAGFENFTEAQLFFLSAAQDWCSKTSKDQMTSSIKFEDHSPNKYRALVPFKNFPAFSAAFSCKEGSGMNPNDKCKIW